MSVRKVYEKQWLESEGNELTIPANEPFNCFELDFPAQFVITKVLLQQTGGGTKDGAFNIYNRLVCPAGDEESDSSAVDDTPPALAKVIPEQAIVNGAMELIDTEGYPYRNMADAGETVRTNKIYVSINPNGTTTSSWNLVIGGYMNSPG